MDAPRGRTRALLLTALPVVVLPGGWAVKNALVYSAASAATSELDAVAEGWCAVTQRSEPAVGEVSRA